MVKYIGIALLCASLFFAANFCEAGGLLNKLRAERAFKNGDVAAMQAKIDDRNTGLVERLRLCRTIHMLKYYASNDQNHITSKIEKNICDMDW